MTQKPPPSPGPPLTNVDAERAVVGSLLIDPAYAAAHVKRLQSADFSDGMARAIIQAYLQGGATDPIEVATRAAEAAGRDTPTFLSYATEQMASVPSAAGIETYATLVLEASERRRGLAMLSRAAGQLMQGRSWDEVGLWIAGQLKERRTAVESRAMPELVAEVADQVDRWHADPIDRGKVRYLTAGYHELNQLTGGLRPALYLCGARPSVGKTALWTQVAAHAARSLATAGAVSGAPGQVLYFTNEMTDKQLTIRLVCSMAAVAVFEVEAGRLPPDDMARLCDALASLRDLPLRLIYARTVRAILSQCYQTERPALVVVDYLNKLLGGEGENRNQVYGSIASALFDMAYDLQVPTVLLCQLNRDLAKRGRNALPEMEDLRDSGELEQIADVVLLLNRTEAEPEELHVVKRKDRVGGGQHQAITLTFGPFARITSPPRSAVA